MSFTKVSRKTRSKRSSKGRFSGGARKELNEERVAKTIAGEASGIQMARVVKILGMGRVNVLMEMKGRPETVQARIPSIFQRKGATPIDTDSIVSIFVGEDFDPKMDTLMGSHLEITAILTNKDAQTLKDRGELPAWMTQREPLSYSTSVVSAPDDLGFEFDYTGIEEKEEVVEEKETEKEISTKVAEEDEEGFDLFSSSATKSSTKIKSREKEKEKEKGSKKKRGEEEFEFE
jgi:hypothetical protein